MTLIKNLGNKVKGLLPGILLFMGCVFQDKAGWTWPEGLAKDRVIEKELKCIAGYAHENRDFIWEEVCYNFETEIEKRARLMIIDEELDRVSAEVKSNRSHDRKDVLKKTRTIDFKRPPDEQGIKRYDENYRKERNDDWREDIFRTLTEDEPPIPPEHFLDAYRPLLNRGSRFNISSGFRRDDLQWSIADSDGSPDVLSELTWSNLAIQQIKASANLEYNRFVLDGILAYGDIFAGKNQDSDYLVSGHGLEFSRSNNKSNDGEAWDVSGALGYRFLVGPGEDLFVVNNLWVTPLLGYSYHKQNLIMTDGFQDLDPFRLIGITGAFSGLHSRYRARWQGPFGGIEMIGQRHRLTGMLRIEYHYADYYAWATWNLRSDFAQPKSFEQETTARGFIYRLAMEYDLSPRWSILASVDLQNWNGQSGKDRIFLSSGGTSTTRLNGVTWDSLAVMLGVTFWLNPLERGNGYDRQ